MANFKRREQGSADPAVHLGERDVPMEMSRRSPNADASVDERPRAKDGAREPAPGEANPLAEHAKRGGDQRTDAFD